MPEPHLRAGDTDRTAVATVLGRHMADGRLTVAEYDDRVSRAYAARTYGELAELTADLPATDGGRAVDPARRDEAREHRASPQACGPSAVSRRGHADSWAAWRRTAVIVLAIWAIISLTSGPSYFWPIWVIGPWGAILLAQTIGGPRHGSRSRQHT